MYMIREVWYCKRGKAPEIAEDMKKANQLFVSQGNTTGRILVDVSGRMDTVVFQFEVESPRPVLRQVPRTGAVPGHRLDSASGPPPR